MHSEETSSAWYLVQLKPNCHKIAVRNLNRQGFRTFMPLEERTRKKGAQFVTELKPLFPGYLFVMLNPDHGEWRCVNHTYGVSSLLTNDGVPSRVPADIIRMLEQRCDENSVLLPLSSLRPGSLVQFSKGPMAEYVARVENIVSNQRVWLLLDFMGRSMKLEADMGALRSV